MGGGIFFPCVRVSIFGLTCVQFGAGGGVFGGGGGGGWGGGEGVGGGGGGGYKQTM